MQSARSKRRRHDPHRLRESANGIADSGDKTSGTQERCQPYVRKRSDGSWLPPEQAAPFLDLAEADHRAFVGAACCLLLLNGLRASEPLKLGVSDYYRVGDTPVVHVNRKFDWMKEVGLSERAAKAVERAIGERRKGPLPVWKGKRVTYPQLAGVVAVLGERVGAAALPATCTSTSASRRISSSPAMATTCTAGFRCR